MANYSGTRFAFTILRPDNDALALVKKLEKDMNYLIMGLEIAPNSGTIHFQGYFETKVEWNLFKLKSQLPKCYLQLAVKDRATNAKYCKKSGIFREIQSASESRSDIAETAPSVELFKDFRKLLDKCKEHIIYS